MERSFSVRSLSPYSCLGHTALYTVYTRQLPYISDVYCCYPSLVNSLFKQLLHFTPFCLAPLPSELRKPEI